MEYQGRASNGSNRGGPAHRGGLRQWKIAFDEHVTIRKQHACAGEKVLQADGNPNEVLVLTTWPSLKEAHAFAEDPSRPEAMKQAKVVGAPPD